MSQIKQVVTDADIEKCRRAVQALRPQLTDSLYQEAVQKTLEDNRQIIFIEADGEAGAVAVFETGYNLFRGKYIYIDDLSTLPEHRGNGYAGMLLDWILDYAKKNPFRRSIWIQV